jgi:hypothetical protein
MDMQISFDDVVEKFRTLRQYSVSIKPADGVITFINPIINPNN